MKTPSRLYPRSVRSVSQFLQGSLLFTCVCTTLPAVADTVADYERYSKYSPLKLINKQNVTHLEKAWEYHSGDLPPEDLSGKLIALEDQPTLIDGNLVVCTTKRRVIALDPKTGRERWSFDPKDPLERDNIGMRKCRGISHWIDPEAEQDANCKSRIFLGTADYRLVSIDAKNGKPCQGFGNNGQVAMPPSIPELFPGEVIATSNPAIVNDVVVVGSAVADNQRVTAPSGRVMAYHARTGQFMWQFDPVPRNTEDVALKSWSNGTDQFGQGNVWSSMAVDNSLDMVYLPTTSPSSDFYGGDRVGDNNYTTSVVALKGKSGEVVWHFQVVHHNVFDYDVPTQPMLIDYPYNGEMVPALVQNTKMGIVFIFNRETGEPLVPIEERAVPQDGGVKGETLSPTQPFTVGMPALVKHGFSPEDAWGFSFIDKWLCKRVVEDLQYGPIYTPVSEKGTIFSPSAGGGPNWGGGAYDPESHIMVVPTNRVPMIVRLIPREKSDIKEHESRSVEGMKMTFNVKQSPFITQVEPLLSPLGAPCSEPPWAGLTGIDIVRKKIVWDVPLGSIEKLMPIPIPLELGTPGAGGPLVTAGGLAFIAYTLDDTFRAFDLHTGEVLWSADLPAAGTAVPVTYTVDGEQYIVIAAGGHSMYGSTMGDAVVAFRLQN